MIVNYIKIILRNISRYRLYSLINIAGLSVALLCIFLILSNVKEELSYERFFPKSDRIYRITMDSKSGDTYRRWAQTPPPLGPMLAEAIPEIEQTARFRSINSVIMSYTSEQAGVRRFKEEGGLFADPAVVDIFDLKFIKGERQTALDDVNTVVLTESMAKRYFGDGDPIGKSLADETTDRLYRITGIIEDMPSNTHLQFEYLVSMSTFYQSMNNHPLLQSRTWKALYTYALLDVQNQEMLVESKLSDFLERSFQSRFEQSLHLQRITDIHLHSKLEKEISANSDIVYAYIFSLAAILILLIAGVNFVNLTTAQAIKRTREVGVRKVLGAKKQQLIQQFLGESFALVCAANIVSVLLLDLILPFYNTLSGKHLEFIQLVSIENIAIVFVLVIATGLSAGLYPALFISGLRPASALKEQKTPGSSIAIVRKGLVVFQFIVSIFMICCTITIYRQLIFFREADLGFDKKKLIAVQLYGDLFRNTIDNLQAVKNELLSHSAISHVSSVSNLPGDRLSLEHLRPENILRNDDVSGIRIMQVDEDFLETLGLKLTAGRNFQKRSDALGQFLLSETAVQALDLQDPVGKKANNYGNEGEIMGVFRDFHFASLHDAIEPLVLRYNPSDTDYLLVKFHGANTSEVLTFVETKLQGIAPDHLFVYEFVDENLKRLYVFEDRLGDIFKAFTIMAIFIACLGLFGLSAYTTELKIKEIGIRKVLGASVLGITGLLSKNFMRWIIIANILAWPVAYFAMKEWLQNFAYKIDVEISTFILSAVISITVALLTVSYQSIKAALANPVETLRYE